MLSFVSKQYFFIIRICLHMKWVELCDCYCIDVYDFLYWRIGILWLKDFVSSFVITILISIRIHSTETIAIIHAIAIALVQLVLGINAPLITKNMCEEK